MKVIEGITVTQPCVLKWVRKYMELMKSYLDKFTPQLGGIWHSDEMMVNVRRTQKIRVGAKGEQVGYYSWAWNLMDHQTRFLIASEVTKHRYVEDAKKVLRQAKDVASGQVPDFIVTDKLPAYPQAITNEFYTQTKPRTEHVKLKSFREGTNNNILERLNGTVKERTKVMRGMNTDESAKRMLGANQTYYNYLRPHSALDGKTPAEEAGIDLKLGEGNNNKYQELIRRAKKRNIPKVISEKTDSE